MIKQSTIDKLHDMLLLWKAEVGLLPLVYHAFKGLSRTARSPFSKQRESTARGSPVMMVETPGRMRRVATFRSQRWMRP